MPKNQPNRAGALLAVTIAAMSIGLVTGCSHQDNNRSLSEADYAKAFQKSAPPAGYTAWQQKKVGAPGEHGVPSSVNDPSTH